MAKPHSMPPKVPPAATRVCQRISPVRGSSPCMRPDFWPAMRIGSPPEVVVRTGELPKSKSGPTSAGQLARTASPARPQALFHASPAVLWVTQRTAPVPISSAINASLSGAGGLE